MTEDNNNKIVDLKLSVISTGNYAAPDINEVASKRWIKYGDDNDYFEYLLDRYRGSPTNHGLINGIYQMAYGQGYTSPDKMLSPIEWARVEKMFPDDDVLKWFFDLKCMGMYVQQVIRSINGENIVTVKHSPVQNWRSGKADNKGVIHEYWYSDDWLNYTNPRFRPVSYPAYKVDANVPVSIYCVKPYRAGSFYYPTVDYLGGLQYAQLEEEIANFHLNNIMNGLHPSMLINFNNGDPGKEERDLMERRIQKKWGGTSNSGRMILAFNDDKESAASIESVPIADADKQYTFLSEESQRKILVSHRVTSPLLFGIRDSAGLGSNTDEIRVAFDLFRNTVIKPYRDIVSTNMERIMHDAGIDMPITFIDMMPVDWGTPTHRQASEFSMAKEDKGSDDDDDSHCAMHVDMTEDDEAQWIAHMHTVGEVIDDEEWALIGEEAVTDPDNEDEYLERMLGGQDGLNEQNINIELTREHSNPQKRSVQDTVTLGIIKIRYGYTPARSSHNSRAFCVEMAALSRNNVVYRKEDILAMGKAGVNSALAPKGRSRYSIWLYKGGVNCHHYWSRRFYERRWTGKGFVKRSQTPALEGDNPITEREYRQVGIAVRKWLSVGTKQWQAASRNIITPKDTSTGELLVDSLAHERNISNANRANKFVKKTPFSIPKNDPRVATKPKDMPYGGRKTWKRHPKAYTDKVKKRAKARAKSLIRETKFKVKQSILKGIMGDRNYRLYRKRQEQVRRAAQHIQNIKDALGG